MRAQQGVKLPGAPSEPQRGCAEGTISRSCVRAPKGALFPGSACEPKRGKNSQGLREPHKGGTISRSCVRDSICNIAFFSSRQFFLCQKNFPPNKNDFAFIFDPANCTHPTHDPSSQSENGNRQKKGTKVQYATCLPHVSFSTKSRNSI